MVGEAVPERRLRLPPTLGRTQAGAGVRQETPRRIERDASERDDDAEARERGDLGHQVRMAGGNLSGNGLLSGGAHRTAAAIHTSFNSSPSSIPRENG